MRINVVNVRKHSVRNFCGVLQRDLVSDIVHFTFKVNRFAVNRIASPVNVFYIFDDSAFVVEFITFSSSSIFENDPHATV